MPRRPADAPTSHSDRIKRGQARARARGRVGGRPRTIDYAQADRARALRKEGSSWAEVAEQLGGTGAAWSRLLSRLG